MDRIEEEFHRLQADAVRRHESLLAMGRSVGECWRRFAPVLGSAIAIECLDDDTCLTFEELDRLSRRFEYALRQRGVGAGDVVAYAGSHSTRFWGLLLGCAQVGAPLAIARFDQTPEQLQYAFSGGRSVKLLVLDEGAAEAWHRVRFSRADSILVANLLPPHEVASASTVPARDLLDQPVVYVPTSGTTGAPKMAAITSRKLIASMAHRAVFCDFQRGDRCYGWLEHAHSFLMNIAQAVFFTGGTLVVRDRPTRDQFVADLERAEVTHLPFACNTFDWAAQGRAFDLSRVKSLRCVLGNGGSPEQWLALRTVSGGQERRVVRHYGSTEMPIHCDHEALIVDLINVWDDRFRDGFIPKALSDRFMRIVQMRPQGGELVRAETLDAVTAGDVGELLVRIPEAAQFAGYSVPAFDRSVKVQDRDGNCWYSTGDLVRLEVDGAFAFEGRVADAFFHDGRLFLPHRVEEELRRLPELREIFPILVYGISEGQGGERTPMVAFHLTPPDRGLAVPGDRDNSTVDARVILGALARYLRSILDASSSPAVRITHAPLGMTPTMKPLRTRYAAQGLDAFGDRVFRLRGTEFVPIHGVPMEPRPGQA